ncbi:DMT family transporter [Hallella sp.]|uniref:DMT family transporter n=1 Tax=Hallella sp. TaxID=2980186 RepID=UPI002A91D02E|nr:DMT family transporter [Hallella sp.]MDY5925922.1 DMT family transporter [Hallella sp.]
MANTSTRNIPSKPAHAYLRLHTGILLAGATGVFGRLISLAELPLVWYRMIIATGVLAAVLAVGGRLHRPTFREAWRIGCCGTLLAIHWVLFYGSIKAANVSVGVVCFALNGFFTALLEPMASGKRFSLRDLLLGLITLGGIVLIFGLNMQFRTGIVIGTFSSLFYTLFAIASKRVQSATGVESSAMLLYELLTGWCVLSLAMPFYAMLYPSVSLMPEGSDWLFITLFASVFTIGPFLTQLQALRTLSAFTVNLSYNLEPLYSIALAMLLFNEAQELNLSFWMGVSMIVAAVGYHAVCGKDGE